MSRSTERTLRAALLLAFTSILLVVPSPASAGEYAVPFCLNHPSGSKPGWSYSATNGNSGGIPYFYRNENCGLGGAGLYHRFEVNTVAGGASSDWTFNAPENTYVSRLAVRQTAVPRSAGSADAIYAGLEDGDRRTVAIAVGDSAGSELHEAAYDLPAIGPKAIRIQTSLLCQSGANCAGIWNGKYGNEYYLHGGVVHLTDPTNPAIAVPGGSGWQTSPPDGANPIAYDVTDTGSGVREVRLYVDDLLVEAKTSACEANALVPCPLSASGTMTFNTTRLSEGTHEIALVAVDASGNTTSPSERALTVTVRRPPQASTSSPPTATPGGQSPVAGQPVQGGAGSWSGGDLSFAYQWMRCDQTGQNCVPIPGATGIDYTPTSSDVGHSLMLCVTASNSGGQTQRCSVPTAVVAMQPTPSAGGGGSGSGDRGSANGTPASDRAVLTAVFSSRTTVQRTRFGRRVPISGRLLRPDGAPIAGATLVVETKTNAPGAAMAEATRLVTDADGRFRYVAPPGPSRLVRFGYRAHVNDVSYVDTTDVRLLVTAGVTLKAAPRKVRNKRAAVFTGRVLGKPIPHRGVLVDLQVFYREKWRTFAAPRTNRNGAYRFKYRFTAGAATWKFRARVRPGADYPYEHGLSRQRRVTVTR